MRVVKHGRVVVRRPEDCHHDSAGLDVNIAIVDGNDGHAHGELHRAVVAQQFVDRRVGNAWVIAPHCHLIRVTQQSQRAIADQVDGRFVASDIEQQHERNQLLLAHPIATLFGLDKCRQDVVAEMLAALIDDGDEVGDHLIDCGLGTIEVVVVRCGFERRSDVLRPHAKLGRAFGGHHEHFADHLERDWEREFIDDLHRSAILRTIEDVVDELLDTWSQLFDRRCCERLADETTQTSVIGRIKIEYRL